MMVGVNKERILQGLKVLESQTKDTLKLADDYNADNVSEKVLRVIIGYIDYVNKKVWFKNG